MTKPSQILSHHITTFSDVAELPPAESSFPQLKVAEAPVEAIRAAATKEAAGDGAYPQDPNLRTSPLDDSLDSRGFISKYKATAEPVEAEEEGTESEILAEQLGAYHPKSDVVQVPVKDAGGTREEKSWHESKLKEAVEADAEFGATPPRRDAEPDGPLTPAQKWSRPRPKLVKLPPPHPIDDTSEHADEFMRLATNAKSQEAVRRPAAGKEAAQPRQGYSAGAKGIPMAPTSACKEGKAESS